MTIPALHLASMGLSLVSAHGGPWIAAEALIPGTILTKTTGNLYGPCGVAGLPALIVYEAYASGAVIENPYAISGTCCVRATGISDGDLIKKAAGGAAAAEADVAVTTVNTLGKAIGATFTSDAIDYVKFQAASD